MPSQWKRSRVTLIPKCSPAHCIESDLRPISITPSLAKIAETFIFKFFDEHFNSLVDANQFGCTSNRSTTHALIKFSHHIFTASDTSANFIRILFIDFTKAFDLIDHNVLLQKLLDYNFPQHITVWSMSFLENREQFVRVAAQNSSTLKLKSGCPQGTLGGPNNFKVMINDLAFSLSYIKYVDDTSVASVSADHNDNSLQTTLDELSVWCNKNSMRINVNKTKEIRVHFGKSVDKSKLTPLVLDGVAIETVNSFKLLGVYFNSELTWKHHIDYILNKVAKRIYFIYVLVRTGVKPDDVVSVYCAIIRSILEYASPVWHAGLTKAQSNDIEGVQKRCLRIIYPELSYNEALFVTGLDALTERREKAMRSTFDNIKKPDNVLNSLLQLKPTNQNNTRMRRKEYPYFIERAKTSRLNRSFISYCINHRF